MTETDTHRTIGSTLSADEAARRRWGAIVIGAGPAGAGAAIAAAQRGVDVLLVDKAPFPRPKVCGGCLNGAALAAMRSLGIDDAAMAAAGAPVIGGMRLAAGRRIAAIRLPPGRAISRTTLDELLVRRAIDQGVSLLSPARARIAGAGRVRLDVDGAAPVEVTTELVIAGHGLDGDCAGDRSTASPGSRFGVGATLDRDAAGDDYPAGTIHMGCGSGGYAGLVRVEGGRLNIAAAFDPAFVRGVGSPGAAAAATLDEAGAPVPRGLDDAAWHGTAALTRRRPRVWADRLLYVGDSAGYVEPFTGEGMAWAFGSAAAVGELIAHVQRDGWSRHVGEAWQASHGRLVRRRQRVCRALAWALRRPRLVRAGVGVLSAWPCSARPIARRINHPNPGTGPSPTAALQTVRGSA